MATAKLAPALTMLRAQINALYPRRDKSSDGWVGDTSHSRRVSDHNPDTAGWVHALDVDRDGISPYDVVNTAIRDNRVNYVIFEKQIWSRQYAFRTRRYTGANGHTHHIHVSVLHGTPAKDARPWALPGAIPIPVMNVQPIAVSKPVVGSSVDVLRDGMRGDAVLTWQGELWRVGIGVGPHDAIYGPMTHGATVTLQHAAGIGADGTVGPVTRATARKVPNYPKPAGPGLPLANIGGPGDTIRAFQQRLKDRGWDITPDAQYGPKTRTTITKFQRQVGLPADGVGGAATWVALWTRNIT